MCHNEFELFSIVEPIIIIAIASEILEQSGQVFHTAIIDSV
jgi:hypothetical protein